MIDYKDTLNLPRTDFPMKANLARKELEILDYWDRHSIYRKTQERSREKSYILHDGPPYANGHIHLGHALNKILKDMIVKFKSMNGFYAPYVPGWDCHGLPIEHEVDKKLGSKKKEISIIEKRRLCKDYALKFLDIQREEFKRLGVFGDWEEPYLTMSHAYEASIVREFGRFVERGSVYKSKKPVRWCPSCITALAEAEVEYSDKESPSIYVRFRVINPAELGSEYSEKNVSVIIWTTTPWTLPANKGLAVNGEVEYALVANGDEIVIVADPLVENLKIQGALGDSVQVIGKVNGKALRKLRAEHPFIHTDKDDGVRIIFATNFVSTEEGTGVVHIAPGHGEEDYEAGKENGLEVYAPVNEKGCFTEEAGEFSGQFVTRANESIIDKLASAGALLGSAGKTVHSYPHCWRCKKPVIFRATEQWFISMERNNLRGKALDEIKKVTWVPAWGKDRIYGMVDSRPDWCISRQRSWGVPIALFRCEQCGETVTDKSVIDAVVQEVEKAGADVWFKKSEKELLPKGFTCKKCHSAKLSKEQDILDVWFDSGVSFAAVVEADPRFTKSSDLYLEGSDQHRGWFQSSLLASAGTRDKAPYNAVLTHGFVVDGQGKKMSKSLGNVISPQEVTDRHGAEILRLWSASADYREDMRISKEILDRLVEAYRKIRNTCRFLLGNLYDFDMAAFMAIAREAKIKDSLLEIDRFALSTLQGLIEKVTQSYEKFAFHEVFHSIYHFCVIHLSSFYLDVLKDRLYTFRTDSDERRAAQWVLYKLLISLTKLMAPMLSFTSEEIWRFTPGASEGSVFLASFPEVEHEYIDRDLEERWKELLRIRDEVNKSLELKRQEKCIGNSLEARLILYVDEKTERILENHLQFLPSLFIVSSAEVSREKPPEDSFKSPELTGLSIKIEKAEGEKCGRCWNWSVTTGNYKDFPGLCERCYGALKR